MEYFLVRISLRRDLDLVLDIPAHRRSRQGGTARRAERIPLPNRRRGESSDIDVVNIKAGRERGVVGVIGVACRCRPDRFEITLDLECRVGRKRELLDHREGHLVGSH